MCCNRWCRTLRVLLWMQCKVRRRRPARSSLEFLSPVLPFVLALIVWSELTKQRLDEKLDRKIRSNFGNSNLDGPSWPPSLNYTIGSARQLATDLPESKDVSRPRGQAHGNSQADADDQFVTLQWTIDKAYSALRKGSDKQKSAVHRSSYSKLSDESDDPMTDMLIKVVRFLTIVSPMPFFVILVSRLVKEKSTGVKELMKMVGVSSGVLYLSHLLNSAATCSMFVVVNTLILKMTEMPMIPDTNGCVIAVTLFLYFVYIAMLAVAWSTVFTGTRLVGSLSACVYLALYWLSVYANEHWHRGSRLFTLCRLLPHVPVYWFWNEVEALMLIVMTLVMVSLVSLPARELRSRARHIHIMSGCPLWLHWGATWLWHITKFTVTILCTLILSLFMLDQYETFNRAYFLVVLYAFTSLYAGTFMVFVYLWSFFMSAGGAEAMLSVCAFLFCIITPAMEEISMKLNSELSLPLYWNITLGLAKLFPPHSYTTGLVKMGKVARLNALCNLNKANCTRRDLHEAMLLVEPNFPRECCDFKGRYGPISYYNLSFIGGDKLTNADYGYKLSSTVEAIVLVCNFVGYAMLIYLLECGFFNRSWDRLANRRYIAAPPAYRDQLVAREGAYVRDNIHSSRRSSQDLAFLYKVHKRYRQPCRAPNESVRGVTFSVKRGECFGLLGVNGAGKSTIFKMLTGEQAVTRGRIVCDGHDLARNRTKYLSHLTYCPQFGGLDGFMSGWNNVELMVLLRGVPKLYVPDEVSMWMKRVGLTELKDRHVEKYSGGCERRCATAAALAGLRGREGRCLALLDEPTAGVDPSARRLVWRALRGSVAAGLSVVLASHSMDETEALCECIAIMVRGQLGAIGTAAQLRAQHAAGYSAQFKLHTASVLATEMEDQVHAFKAYMMDNFNCILRDEHKSMLLYHISGVMRYSELFASLEAAKEQFADFLEDYTISETTLEEVFLLFARQDSKLRTQRA